MVRRGEVELGIWNWMAISQLLSRVRRILIKSDWIDDEGRVGLHCGRKTCICDIRYWL